MWILPTQITDRFGNWVKYTYDTTDPWKVLSISSSDGRLISFTYWSGTHRVQTVSDGTRTWHYNYSSTGTLQSIVLPDSSSWTFNLQALEHNPSYSTDPLCDGTFSLIDQATYTGTITHPSGATGTFGHKMTWHGMSNVPGLQINCGLPGVNQVPAYSASYVGGETALIGTASAVADVGAMGLVGGSVGAAGGMILIIPFGIGYGAGHIISPWVNSHLIDPLYGY